MVHLGLVKPGQQKVNPVVHVGRCGVFERLGSAAGRQVPPPGKSHTLVCFGPVCAATIYVSGVEEGRSCQLCSSFAVCVYVWGRSAPGGGGVACQMCTAGCGDGHGGGGAGAGVSTLSPRAPLSTEGLWQGWPPAPEHPPTPLQRRTLGWGRHHPAHVPVGSGCMSPCVWRGGGRGVAKCAHGKASRPAATSPPPIQVQAGSSWGAFGCLCVVVWWVTYPQGGGEALRVCR